MVLHCENCYCEPVLVFGLDRRINFKIQCVLGTAMFMIMAGMMRDKALQNRFPGWGEEEQLAFLILYILLGISFTTAVILDMFIVWELLWSISGIYFRVLDFLTYLRGCIRFLSLRSICARLSRQSASPQSEDVSAASDFGDELLELPPRTRYTLKEEKSLPLQGLTLDIDPTPSTSGTHSDRRQAEADPQFLGDLQSSIQSALLPKSHKRHTEGSSSRESFKQKIGEINNSKDIVEESGSCQDLSHLEANVRDLINVPKSSTSVSQETSFSLDSDSAKSKEKAMASDVKDIQRKRNIPEGTSSGYVGFSDLQKQQAQEETDKKEKTPKITSAETCIRFSELQEQERISDSVEIQKMHNPESRERTSAARYVESSILQRQEKKVVREEKSTKKTTSPSSLHSTMQTAVRSTYVKCDQENEKYPEEICASSGVVPRHEQTSSQETEIRSAAVERGENIRTSSTDCSSACSQGTEEEEKIERNLSLYLSGGSVVVSRTEREEEGGAFLPSDTDPSGSAFIFDQPENVLDVSHIEVPIILAENEAKTRDDNEEIIISDSEEIQRMHNPEIRERTSAAGYVESSKLQRQERTALGKGKSTEQTTLPLSLHSTMQTAVRSPYVKCIQENKKYREEICVSSSLVPRHEQTSSQETEIRSSGVERGENIRTSSTYYASGSSQGAESNEDEKSERNLSLNLSGGSIVASRRTEGEKEGGAFLPSDTDPSGSAFTTDQPGNVLDFSHIEVPIILPENEAKTREDNEEIIISDSEEIQRMHNPEIRERTSAAGYVESSKLQRQERTALGKGKSTEQTTLPSSLHSTMQTAVRSPYVKCVEENKKYPEEIYASSSLVPRHEQTSSQETEIRSAGVERVEDIRTSSTDYSSACLQGAKEDEKTERNSSLDLSGGSVVVSRRIEGDEAGGACLPSDTDPSASAFIIDQPENVLDVSHIEDPIILPENEADFRDDN